MNRFTATITRETRSSELALALRISEIWIRDDSNKKFEAPSPEVLVEKIAEYYGIPIKVVETHNECGAV